MLPSPLPLSNLDELRRQVLEGPSEAALPCNLPDKWLTLLARDLERCVEDTSSSADEGEYMAAPLAALLHLLNGKSDATKGPLRLEEIYEYFKDYQIEIALEVVRRNTDLNTEPATLETIFTNRRVRVLPLSEPFTAP